MIKAIIFDFDGTLTNRQYNAYGVFNDYLRDYFKELDDIEFEAVLQDFLYYDCNGTIPVKLRLIPFIDKYGKYLPEDFQDNFIPHYYQYMYEYTVLKKDTIDVLNKLQNKYKLAILSNGDSKSQHDKIDKVDISKYFDEVIVTGDYGIHKPNKEIFKIMADKLNVECNECLMIGDVFSTDILGSIKAGMIPVWVSVDDEKPNIHYKGYRIRHLDEIFGILDKENKK